MNRKQICNYMTLAILLSTTPLFSQDWTCPINISSISPTDTLTQKRTFGGDSSATDAYDNGLDFLAPPPAHGFHTYFDIFLFPKYLTQDIRQYTPFQKDSIVWVFKTEGDSASQLISGHIAWNPDSLPQYGEFTIGSFNMRDTSQIVFYQDTLVFIKYKPQVINLSLNVSPIEGGTLSPLVGDTSLFQGDTLHLQANPDSGYKFIGWTGPVYEPDSLASYIIALSDTMIMANFEQIILPPRSRFSVNQQYGIDSLTVQFTDESLGNITSWFWSFGDSDTSTVRNPVHQYTSADSFTVTLITTGPLGSDTLSMPDYIITKHSKPMAHFGIKQVMGHPPLSVEFIDSSTGAITAWFWDFGDGDTSHIQNPTHTYTEPDTFTVSLIVSGPGGMDTLTLNDLIIVLNATNIKTQTEIPTDHALSPIYPNPFNPAANIRFALPSQEPVHIQVYNIRGEMVDQANLGTKEAGYHDWTWDATRFSTGTYFVRIQAGAFHEVRKCVLMK